MRDFLRARLQICEKVYKINIMYVCTYVYTCINIHYSVILLCTFLSISMWLHVLPCTYMFNMCIFCYLHTYVHVYIYMYVHTCTCTCICISCMYYMYITSYNTHVFHVSHAFQTRASRTSNLFVSE